MQIAFRKDFKIVYRQDHDVYMDDALTIDVQFNREVQMRSIEFTDAKGNLLPLHVEGFRVGVELQALRKVEGVPFLCMLGRAVYEEIESTREAEVSRILCPDGFGFVHSRLSVIFHIGNPSTTEQDLDLQEKLDAIQHFTITIFE